jgi:excisionase family DNA binding protein
MNDSENLTKTLWTYSDVATYLVLSQSHVRRLVSQGRLPSIKMMGARRFDQADIERWVSAQKENPASADDE